MVQEKLQTMLQQGEELLQEALKSEGKNASSSDEAVSVLAIFLLLICVILVIVVIAVVIRMVRKNSSDERTPPDEEAAQEDPYLQAIMFPDPRDDWYHQVKKAVKDTSKKLTGKGEPPHEMTIPEHLRPQLRYIYVY